VANGVGRITDNVSDIVVTCTDIVPATYQVCVDVNGMTDNITIENNGGDALDIIDNGEYCFDTELDDGEDYCVTVEVHGGSSCKVTGGDNNKGCGEINGATVTNIDVTCTPN